MEIEKLMKNLDLSYEEAKQLLEDDKAVDKMSSAEVNADLTAEQKKVIKQSCGTGTKKVAPNGKTKTVERKANQDKLDLIETLTKALAESGCEEIEITNAEREFSFHFNEVKYKIVMSVPRK